MEFIDLKAQYKRLSSDISHRINAVLEHGQYILGPEVCELEAKLASFTGSTQCITVSSGTDALLISLMALGVRSGDEVITTAFSFIATAEVIALLGAKPVFVDIDPATCNIDHALVEGKITDKTKAIITVSLYGQPADMFEINQIAEKYGIAVIEDAAQSFGAVYKGSKSCNISKIGCTSFFPSKPLGCYGDGGAIFTSDEDLAEKIRKIRVHGQSERYVHSDLGVAGRMDTIQCAVLLAKLSIFEEEIELRSKVAREYYKKLNGYLEMPVIRDDRTSVFAQFTVYLDNRDLVRDYLLRMKIPTTVHYPIPMPMQPAYIQYAGNDNYPAANMRSKQVLSLPFSPYLSTFDQDRVIDALITSTDLIK